MTNKTYKIYKLSSDKIAKHKFNIKNYTMEDAVLNGEVVSVADNQLFHKIRDYYHEHDCNNIHFESELINIVVPSGNNEKETKCFTDDYHNIALSGFKLNGIQYVRLCSGSGQIRRNTVTFVREELYSYLFEALCCGLKPEDFGTEFNLAKFNAYFGLSMSGVKFLSDAPRVCVISDYEEIRPHEEINFIETVKTAPEGKRKKPNIDKVITKFFYDDQPLWIEAPPPLNSFDGQGLCDPEYARKIALDLGYLETDGTGYIPSEFIIRAPWVKGMVVSFKWKEYCRSCGVTELADIDGVVHYINDIDILLSKSQFKTAKIYAKHGGWQYHVDSMEKYNLRWGVVKANREKDDNYRLLNYQYINALQLSNDDITALCQRTEEHLEKLCSGNINKVYQTLIGNHADNSDNPEDIDDLNTSSSAKYESLFKKAIKHNYELIQDKHIQKLIFDECQAEFKYAKIARIECSGNYQFIVSDPVAQIQHIINAHGLDGNKPHVQGLIDGGCVYSCYWNSKKRDIKQVVLMRSPLIDQSEVAIRNLANSPEMEYWYNTIKSGIILSIHDLTTLQMQNCDMDGDICFSSDNEILICGAIKNPIPLLYPAAAPPTAQTVTKENLIEADIRGLNSKVGSISNQSAFFYAKLAEYAPGTKESEELLRRIKILGELVGVEIDKIKTGVPPSTPTSWSRKPIPKKCSDEKKALLRWYNNLSPDMKPYFMRYNYSKLDNDLITLHNLFNQESVYNYGIKLDALLDMYNYQIVEEQKSTVESDKEQKKDKTLAERQMDTVKGYRWIYPVVDSACSVNKICHKFEALEKKLKEPIGSKNMLSQFVTEQTYDQNTLEKVKEIVEIYKRQRKFITKINNTSSENNKLIKSQSVERYKELDKYILLRILGLCEFNIRESFNYVMKAVKSEDENIVWNIFDDLLLQIVPSRAFHESKGVA